MISLSVSYIAKYSVVRHLLISFFWNGSKNESRHVELDTGLFLTDVTRQLNKSIVGNTTHTARYTVYTTGQIRLFSNQINSCHNKHKHSY